jgi:low temperature requirement protein LtrA
MTSRRMRMEAVTEDASVTPLELFFDLVFVFALTQVTALLARDLTPHGLVRGLLVLGLMWWSWVGYAWLGNVVRADEGAARMAMLSAMAAMFVLALTIPEAFDDVQGGLPGPVVVGVCYFAFRSLHLVLFWIIARDDEGLRRQLVRFAPSMIGGTALLLVASQMQGPRQTLVWAAALLTDYGGTMLAGASGWRLRSAHHFAERHGLILIVALGESIVAIGVGMADLPVSWAVVAAAGLGLSLSAGLWWMYFDITFVMAERALAGAADAEQARLARDAYSYLHLPLIAGVVLLAVGLKKVLEYVGDERHGLGDALKGLGLDALFAGAAIYLVGHAAFKLRTTQLLNLRHVAAGAILLALLPVAARLPALAALGMLAVIIAGLVGFETVRSADERDRLRRETAPANPTGRRAPR